MQSSWRCPGRGRALRSCWLGSDAQVLAYTDVDLSIDLKGLLPLLAPLLSGHSDVAIGTRLARGARRRRSTRREILSRGYNLLLHLVLGAGFSDAQCGFKAITADAARRLLPMTQDNSWFFDTELLVLAERSGLRVHEVPVDCVDDPNSSVRLVSTVIDDLRGVARLAGLSLRGQLSRFVAIGVASTLAYTLIYLGFREVLSSQEANAVSLLITAVANTAANRRFTFGIRGRVRLARQQVQGLIAFGAGLAITSAALIALRSATTRPSHLLEAVVVVAASLVATAARYVLYRWWVFRPRQEPVAHRTRGASASVVVARWRVGRGRGPR